jgi:hypothetical protein
MATYYIDTNDFATATSIWTNSNLTVKAANGFYQKDGVYRQMSGGELLPVANCPECFYAFDGSVMAANSANACSSAITETYYFENVDGGVGETEPEIGDLVFSDDEGTTPLAAGFYKVVSGNYIQVNSSGVVIAKAMCPADQSQFTIYFDVTTSPNTYGWGSSSAACAGTGTPITVYITGSASSLFNAVVTLGKVLYTNVGRTTPLNGNNTHYKTVSAPASGETLLIDGVGVTSSWGGPC